MERRKIGLFLSFSSWEERTNEPSSVAEGARIRASSVVTTHGLVVFCTTGTRGNPKNTQSATRERERERERNEEEEEELYF